jgi:hypothetical protein
VAGALNLRSCEQFRAEAKDMTADSAVAEIEVSGGTALGIEVDVRGHEQSSHGGALRPGVRSGRSARRECRRGRGRPWTPSQHP